MLIQRGEARYVRQTVSCFRAARESHTASYYPGSLAATRLDMTADKMQGVADWQTITFATFLWDLLETQSEKHAIVKALKLFLWITKSKVKLFQI